MLFNNQKNTVTFGGNTGGLLLSNGSEEKYVISWPGKAGKIFELPTGGSAIMKEGKNTIFFARKEQCLAVGSQLRTLFKINDYKIYRIFATGEVQYLHPKDGMFPEKVNQGRKRMNSLDFPIIKKS